MAVRYQRHQKMSDYDKINLKEKEIKNQNPKKNRETGTKGNGAKNRR